jgi:hypothetical protein
MLIYIKKNKMKHVKLFENFSKKNPVITATADFTGITLGGKPIDWVLPRVYNVTFHTNPSPELEKEAYNQSGNYYPGPDDYLEDIISADQNGSNILREDVLTMAVDGNYTPEDYKRVFEDYIRRMNSDVVFYDEETCTYAMDGFPEKLDPKYRKHCKAVADENRNSPHLMKERVSLNFKIV